ncbi:helix-turn-helix domain-containing protein [Saccharococcus caldoxylosilyticus]|uniref:helix-turn-helix domain-containing protein n=1 Tax=Saccharococcus caldoxylosilyticus TaxID=81408 RepID=UPI0002F0DF32|nr:AraC family transcriptional regulator [Parageobacillus caldoxylosilyticus]
MKFLKVNINKPVHFISGGQFITEQPWTHSQRIIDSFEIIIGINKILYIQEDNTQYEVKPGDVLLLLPNHVHKGYIECDGGLSFYWFHFYCQEYHEIIDKSAVNDDLLLMSTHSLSQHPITDIYLPLFWTPSNLDRINILSQQLLDVANSNYYIYHSTNYLLTSLLIELSEQYIALEIKQNRTQADLNLERIKEWIRINIHNDISVASIAEKFNYNKTYLSRFFKQKTGMSLLKYLHYMKIRKAKQLLSSTSYSIKEISYKVGIQDEKYFMRLFKKHENMTPSEFRKAYYRIHMNNN